MLNTTPQSTDDLLASLYQELRALALQRLTRLPPNQTLQATDLVHEVYARFAREGSTDWANRAHFFGAAAQAMRNILAEHARARTRQKRGGGWERVTLSGVGDGTGDVGPDEILAVSDALDRLEASSPDAARIVLLRYFGGLTIPEIAVALETSPSSVERRWRFARAWLQREIGA